MTVAQKTVQSGDHDVGKYPNRFLMSIVAKPDDWVDITFFSSEPGVILETLHFVT